MDKRTKVICRFCGKEVNAQAFDKHLLDDHTKEYMRHCQEVTDNFNWGIFLEIWGSLSEKEIANGVHPWEER